MRYSMSRTQAAAIGYSRARTGGQTGSICGMVDRLRDICLSNRTSKASHFHSRRLVMTQELRIDLIIKMSQAIDNLLLSWDAPEPTLNEAIAAQIQSLARAISATTDPGPSLATVKQDLDSIVADILRTYHGRQN